MKFKRIKPPKFYIGRYALNEYELMQVMLEVAEGRREHGLVVKNKRGAKTLIRPDGTLRPTVTDFGFSMSHVFFAKLLEADRKRREQEYTKKYKGPWPKRT